MLLRKYHTIFFIFLFFSFSSHAQQKLQLSREECEAIFLKENLLLIAEKLNIPKAEAIVMQSKLWQNPTIEVNDINLWATKKQLAVFGDDLKGFRNSNFGKNQQFTASIEQLILTAGKRKKLVALEQVSVEKSKEYFQDLLRNLKTEFRNRLTNLQYLQLNKNIYQNQFNSVKQLTQAYKNQSNQENIPKSEYVRLKALELELAQNINTINSEINEEQKEIKLLMNLPINTEIEISENGYWKKTAQIETLSIDELLNKTKDSRPDFNIHKLEKNYFNKLYTYEKSQKTPNITIKAGYDRGGSFMYNFFGFGAAVDLPVFNRNQGNIRYAKIGIEQSEILQQHKELSIEAETLLAFQNLSNALNFLEQIEAGYEKTLDDLLTAYTKNFSNRNIGLLEYLDFLGAYMENKTILLKMGKDINHKSEELNYAVGQDVIF